MRTALLSLMAVSLFAGEPPTIHLGPLTEAERSKPAKPGVAAIGVHRTLPPGSLKKGKWMKDAGGHKVWRLRIQSAEAKGLRLHFTAADLGSHKITLRGSGSAAYKPYTGKGPLGDGDFWSEVVEGDAVTIEYDGDPSKPPPFQLAAISHLFRSVFE
ncbi:MAG: hypothetical protein U0Q16_29005 [Bryobacteraceae bacterium]